MAVDDNHSTSTSSALTTGRRMLIGTNVAVAIVLVAGIVAVLQAIAYSAPKRWDMTSTGVNSLSEGTENLLRNLDTKLRLTSLYFQTDLEEEDQQRYRRAVEDLLELYASTNRGLITAEYINPLSDHEKFNALVKRQREKPASKATVATYAERIDKYRDDLDAKMRALVERELQAVGSVGSGLVGQSTPEALGQIEFLFMRWRETLEEARDEVDALMTLDDPQYAAAADQIAGIYGKFVTALTNVEDYADATLSHFTDIPEDQVRYLREAGDRFDELATEVESEQSAIQALEPLQSDEVLSQISPTGNALLVETDEESIVVDFSSIWPPMDESRRGDRVPFSERAFKGEEKVTSAILRATHKEQTAVVFVRYGGRPPFSAVPIPNQPPAPYATMKLQLEDANFIVKEWDLKAGTEPPQIDPAPTRTIYVVLKPTAPSRAQFGQRSQDPPFTDSHRQALLDALGDNGRAVFIVGWTPGPFGPIPSTYEYGQYLTDTWGITIDTASLLIEATEISPGRYNVTRRDFHTMSGFDLTDHDIVAGSHARELILPWCAPIDLSENPPEGVEYSKLVVLPRRDGVWGIKDVKKYEEQFNARKYLTMDPSDRAGPFDLAVAAVKGDAKIVVISSREFAVDRFAFAREFSMGPRGFTIRSRNPGNVTLLVNSLHWLNDNTEFMNIGQPIDVAVLNIESKSRERFVQVLTMFIWPALALCCGGMTWWIRRR